jgi:hypothetical protein
MKHQIIFFVTILLTGSFLKIDAQVLHIASIYDCLNSDIIFENGHASNSFDFQPFPIAPWSELMVSNPTFKETFIVRIADGKVYSRDGLIILGDVVLKELVLLSKSLPKKVREIQEKDIQQLTKIKGRVAVITTLCKRGDPCYFHWMTQILGRLALLESRGFEYDWLYVPISMRFMKETLVAWGVPLEKIIEPSGDNFFIQADELIVPSIVSQIDSNHPPYASYVQPWLIDFLRSKFLPLIQDQMNQYNFSEKIFISRLDAGMRKVTNEDELFLKLEQQGFKRYVLAQLSFLEQIILFHQAKIIVSFHGAGLTNLVFASSGTKVIEIFQAHGYATYWYLSQMLGLDHVCIKTVDFTKTNSFMDTKIPLLSIEAVMNYLR